MIPKKVFVSWQSGNGIASKKFKDAVSKIRTDYKYIELDEATRDTTGAPSIIDEIYKKIDNCDVFMCDLSIECTNGNRNYPNSNVLYELGYAIKTLGEYNCILFFDKSQHDVPTLPFDVKHMRVSLITDKADFYKDMVQYINSCVPKYISMKLTNVLNHHIENISDAPNNVVTEKYVDDLNKNIQIYIDTINDDNIKEEINKYFSQFRNFRGTEMGMSIPHPKADKDNINMQRYYADMKIIDYSRCIHMNIGPHVRKMLHKIFDL